MELVDNMKGPRSYQEDINILDSVLHNVYFDDHAWDLHGLLPLHWRVSQISCLMNLQNVPKCCKVKSSRNKKTKIGYSWKLFTVTMAGSDKDRWAHKWRKLTRLSNLVLSGAFWDEMESQTEGTATTDVLYCTPYRDDFRRFWPERLLCTQL